MLPELERRHDVLAPALPGHAGGPPLPAPGGHETLVDGVERALDEAGLATAHLVGSSLGGHVALHLAARGRAETVTAFAPGGGWAEGDDGSRKTLEYFAAMHHRVREAAPRADAIAASRSGRRAATRDITVRYEHLSPAFVAHQIAGAAACEAALPLVDHALREGWSLDAERIACPVRIVWGTEDRILPWPRAAARYRSEWLPHADWVELDGVGHCPQLDVPQEAARLILETTSLR